MSDLAATDTSPQPPFCPQFHETTFYCALPEGHEGDCQSPSEMRIVALEAELEIEKRYAQDKTARGATTRRDARREAAS